MEKCYYDEREFKFNLMSVLKMLPTNIFINGKSLPVPLSAYKPLDFADMTYNYGYTFTYGDKDKCIRQVTSAEIKEALTLTRYRNDCRSNEDKDFTEEMLNMEALRIKTDALRDWLYSQDKACLYLSNDTSQPMWCDPTDAIFAGAYASWLLKETTPGTVEGNMKVVYGLFKEDRSKDEEDDD